MIESLTASAFNPLVTIAYAQSLDGRIATKLGDSHYISGHDSLRLAHQLRAEHDAVMIGVGTVLQDNPRLNVRLVTGPDPVKVVVDTSLRTPTSSALLAGASTSRVIFAVTEMATLERRAAVVAKGASVVEVAAEPFGRVNLRHLLTKLADFGLRTILVEGGAELITSLLRDHLAHTLLVAIAPKLIGSGVEAVGDLGITRLQDAISLLDRRTWTSGDDVVVSGRLHYRTTENAN